tara:strand:- start:1079 stop:1945 length:867 start_codon:yes stop_codon:yes gene_type:complete
MKLSEYKLLGIIMILVAVVYFMNRSIKYLKNKIVEIENKMSEDKGDNLRAIKSIEHTIDSKRIKNSSNDNLQLLNKVKLLEDRYKNLEKLSLENEEWKNNLKKNSNNQELKKNEILKNRNNEEFKSVENVVEYFSDSDSELEVLSENIAIYSNDNEDVNISNSDLEDLSIGELPNKSAPSENSDSMIPNIVDTKELIATNEDLSKESPKLDVDIIEDNLSQEKKSDQAEMNLDDLLKLKLIRLQCMAEEEGLEITRKNGKKKTKKELADEILGLKLNLNNKVENTSSV